MLLASKKKAESQVVHGPDNDEDPVGYEVISDEEWRFFMEIWTRYPGCVPICNCCTPPVPERKCLYERKKREIDDIKDRANLSITVLERGINNADKLKSDNWGKYIEAVDKVLILSYKTSKILHKLKLKRQLYTFLTGREEKARILRGQLYASVGSHEEAIGNYFQITFIDTVNEIVVY